ncbi:MAG: folate-binding protein [Pseudohongiellaceae bacterium]
MQNKIYPLSHYEFIRVCGPDSRSFLQGQLSCNTDLLSDKRSLVGALCNLKGRVIADFRLLEIGGDCLLQCGKDMADPILATLGNYAVFSKVELSQLDDDAAATPRAFGLIGATADAALAWLELTLPESTDQVSQSNSCSVMRLPGPATRIEIWFHSSAAQDAFFSQANIETSGNLDAWLRADIEAGMIHVTKELSEEYTPQLLNYDIAGLIDFKKGCYTGQEIVARMFYRGTAKKRLYLLSSNVEVSADSRVVLAKKPGAADESTGSDILAYNNNESSSLLLAVLTSETVESGEKLQLSDKAGSVLSIQSLPYAEIPTK